MADITIECCGVSKHFSGMSAVNDVSLRFQPARITAIVGPNGAGKTTLFDILTGFQKADAGSVFLNDQKIDGLSARKISLAGVGRLFQEVRVFQGLSVIENVLIGFPGQRGENPLRAVICRRTVLQEEASRFAEAERLLSLLHLSDLRLVPARALSHGQQKLLAVARLMANGAGVLLLDEPTTGLHPEMAQSLLTMLKGLSTDGKTIGIIEHNLSIIHEFADWVYFMEEGRITEQGVPGDVLVDKFCELGSGISPRRAR
jgi:ABC-type branched-subunit amino acid transport system ATPase component